MRANPKAFPPVFHEIAGAADAALPIRAEFATRKEAEKTRFNWYYFLKAATRFGDLNAIRAQRIEATIEDLANGRAVLMFALRAQGMETLTQAVELALGRKVVDREAEEAVAGLQKYMKDHGMAGAETQVPQVPTMSASDALFERWRRTGKFTEAETETEATPAPQAPSAGPEPELTMEEIMRRHMESGPIEPVIPKIKPDELKTNPPEKKP